MQAPSANRVASWFLSLAIHIFALVPIVFLVVMLGPNLIESGFNGWVALAILTSAGIGATILLVQHINKKPKGEDENV